MEIKLGGTVKLLNNTHQPIKVFFPLTKVGPGSGSLPHCFRNDETFYRIEIIIPG